MKLSQSNMEFLLAEQISLRDRNVMLLTHLQQLIEQNRLFELKEFVVEMNKNPDIHVSLNKGAYIMIENLPGFENLKIWTDQFVKEKLAS